jgi:hypothetical protein
MGDSGLTFYRMRLERPTTRAKLVAEIEQLRAALAPLVERCPVDHGHMDQELCGYCDAPLGWAARNPQEHAPDCPWVRARDLLATEVRP